MGLARTIEGSPVVGWGPNTVIIEYDGDDSFQAIQMDVLLVKDAGVSTALEMRYLGGIMGRVGEKTRNDGLTETKNMIFGLCGKYDVTGTVSSTYPAGAVVGEVSGASSGKIPASADGAFIAVLGGDEGPVQARAAYTVDFQNTGVHAVGKSFFEYGLDLEGVSHDSYMAANYSKADIRLGNQINGSNAGQDVVIFRKSSGPTDGASGDGAGYANTGSLLIQTNNGRLYINTGSKASPTWTLVGSQSA